MNPSALFPNSQHSDSQPAATSSAPPSNTPPPEERDEQLGRQLFPSMQSPDERAEKPAGEPPAAKSEEDVAAKLYNTEAVYTDAVLVPNDQPDATPEQIAEANASYRQELAKLELPGVTARELTDTFRSAMKTPLSDAEYDARVEAFPAELARRFGSEAQERLADVQKLLAKGDPAVADALVQSGLNYDIEVVAKLADVARSLKGRGRL